MTATLNGAKMPTAVKPCCEMRRQLSEQFAIAARLYGDAVIALTTSSNSQLDHARLCRKAQEMKERAEAAMMVFEEHVDSHRCYDGEAGVLNIASGRRTA